MFKLVREICKTFADTYYFVSSYKMSFTERWLYYFKIIIMKETQTEFLINKYNLIIVFLFL